VVTRDGLTIASVWSKPALSNVTDFVGLTCCSSKQVETTFKKADKEQLSELERMISLIA